MRRSAIAMLVFLAASMLLGLFGASPAAAAPGDSVRVFGVLRNGTDKVAGVELEAKDASGTVVGTATSSATGAWSINVPPGQYTIVINTDSLPDGVEVQKAELPVDVSGGTARPVIFSFGDVRTGTEVSAVSELTRLAIDGIRFGLIIAITGVGLSLIFGTTGLTNFAHGELVTLGAVIAWVINVKLGVQLIPATILAVIVGIGIGILNELGLWRPLRRRRTGLIAMLVVSIGLSLVLRYLILIFFSDRAEPFDDYQAQTQIGSGPFAITPVNLACIIISIVVLLGVALLLQRTRIGKAMRAVADNKDLAESSGIDVDRVILFVWALAGGLATLGGVMFALSELGGRVQWEMGFKLLLLMFAGITLGGLGTAYGALLGCVIVGLLVQLSTYILSPDLKYIGGLLILIIILTIRPQGILGSRARIG
ncbi:branched-chain amino acid ABC transporter permease [Gordonia hongkongensis]|uniref:Branched-chain amino acid ABC transporter permease n=3 Tax=Gordoniaceae TaxID=85026 RepID=A0AAX3TDK5_9ACTN|nr:MULTISPECIES: branched-chain amino acid ABC transporter permease [Gordonia]MDF6103804.1 branched-chain amino acid ABC transporter permease [Gordonia hongkongensis]WFP27260.1 branched-chain amino acid ABC transporter permease [Gordonia hongkongensis]